MSNKQSNGKGSFFQFKPQRRSMSFWDGMEDTARAEYSDDARALLEAFRLFYTPRTVSEANRIAEKATAIDEEKLTLSARVARLVDLLAEVFSGWQGCTPETVHVLAPDFVGNAEVAAMQATLEANGCTEFPYSVELCTDLCEHSPRFWTIAIQLINKLAAKEKEVAEDRKNAPSSGVSTGLPGDTTAKPTTGETTTRENQGQSHPENHPSSIPSDAGSATSGGIE